MNNTFCWHCGRPFEYDGEKYRDVNCVHCNVQNSILNPNKPDWKPENQVKTTEGEWLNEEETMVNYDDEKYQGKYIYLPLMKETATFEIVEIHEAKSENPKVNFSEKVPVTANGEQVVDDDGEPVFKSKDLGYHIEATLKNGKVLSITSMSAFIQVFKKNNIQDGDHIRVFHKDKAEWIVEKL
jgi:hypothetical protein